MAVVCCPARPSLDPRFPTLTTHALLTIYTLLESLDSTDFLSLPTSSTCKSIDPGRQRHLCVVWKRNGNKPGAFDPLVGDVYVFEYCLTGRESPSLYLGRRVFFIFFYLFFLTKFDAKGRLFHQPEFETGLHSRRDTFVTSIGLNRGVIVDTCQRDGQPFDGPAQWHPGLDDWSADGRFRFPAYLFNQHEFLVAIWKSLGFLSIGDGHGDGQTLFGCLSGSDIWPVALLDEKGNGKQWTNRMAIPKNRHRAFQIDFGDGNWAKSILKPGQNSYWMAGIGNWIAKDKRIRD